MRFEEYYKIKTPEVKEAPLVPDLGGWIWGLFPGLKSCNCHKRKVWLNGVWARLWMFWVKIRSKR